MGFSSAALRLRAYPHLTWRYSGRISCLGKARNACGGLGEFRGTDSLSTGWTWSSHRAPGRRRLPIVKARRARHSRRLRLPLIWLHRPPRRG